MPPTSLVSPSSFTFNSLFGAHPSRLYGSEPYVYGADYRRISNLFCYLAAAVQKLRGVRPSGKLAAAVPLPPYFSTSLFLCFLSCTSFVSFSSSFLPPRIPLGPSRIEQGILSGTRTAWLPPLQP